MDALPSPAEAHKFRVREFEGPLDLLLFLIQKNEINIYDIPIGEITEQYLGYLHYVGAIDLEGLTEFHSMAASLLFIKSRMLLPIEFSLEDEMEDPRHELVETLIEYQKYKKLSELIEEKGREAEWALERKKLQPSLQFIEEELWEKVDVWDLLTLFSKLKYTPGEQIIDLYEEISVNEKIALLAELLDQREECLFTDLVVRNGSTLDIICAFLAILDAVKNRMIQIYQNRMFGDILIRSVAAPQHTGEA